MIWSDVHTLITTAVIGSAVGSFLGNFLLEVIASRLRKRRKPTGWMSPVPANLAARCRTLRDRHEPLAHLRWPWGCN